MTGGCGHVPLSADAAARAVTDLVAQLTAAAELLPESSAMRQHLGYSIRYAQWVLSMLAAGGSVHLLEAALARQVAISSAIETTPGVQTADDVMCGPVALDLFLAVGAHQHAEARS